MARKVLITLVFSTSILTACSPYTVPQDEAYRNSTINLSVEHSNSGTYNRLYEDCSREIDSHIEDSPPIPLQKETITPTENGDNEKVKLIISESLNLTNSTGDDYKNFIRSAQNSFNRIGLDTQHPFLLMDAAALAMQFNRDIQKSHMQYQQSLGSLEITSGAFDTNITAEYDFTPSYSSSDGESVLETETSFYSVGVNKISRFGLETNAFFSLNGDQSTLNNAESVVGQGQLGLVFTMPVLKQSGTVSANAEERANIILVEAALARTAHQINSTLNNITEYYWDYVASLHQLLLIIDAELSSKTLLDDTKVLVTNAIQANSDLHPLKADYANNISERRVSEQNVIEARNQLAVALGFPVKLAKTLPAPTSNFANLDFLTACSIKYNEPSILGIALDNRQDLRAAELTVQQSKIMEEKYQKDLLPGLNLVAGMTQTGFTPSNTLSDMFDSPGDGEFAVKAGIQMEFPVFNKIALGQLRNQVGQTREQQLAYIAVKETITSDINNAVTALSNALEVVQLSEYGEEQYLQATDDEVHKFKLGMSSILDVLNTSDRLNTTRQNTVSAKLNLAKAIVNLRSGSATFFDGTTAKAETDTTVSETELLTPFPVSYMEYFTKPENCSQQKFD